MYGALECIFPLRIKLNAFDFRSSMAGQFTFYSECGKQTLGCVLGATPSLITE